MNFDIQTILHGDNHGPESEAALAAEISTARRANDQLPIFRLPPEMLLRITSALAQYTLSRRSDMEVSAAVRLLHVCSRWREIAFACRETWATIPLRNPEIAQIFLDRSHHALIQLLINSNYLGAIDYESQKTLSYYNAVALATGHLSRVCLLHVEMAGPEDAERILPLLSASPLPELEEWHFLYCDESTDAENLQLPPPLFSGCPPTKLKVLELLGCSNPFTPPLLQSFSLTKIELSYCRVWETVDEMVATLACLPLLETFNASNIEFLLGSALSTVHPPRCVHLPNMQSLLLTADFHQCITMFHYLHLPVTAIISFDARDFWDEISTDGTFRSLVASSFRDHYAPFISAGRICDNAVFSASGTGVGLTAIWGPPKLPDQGGVAWESVNLGNPRLEVRSVPVAVMSTILDVLSVVAYTKTLTIKIYVHSPVADQPAGNIWRSLMQCVDVRDLFLVENSMASLIAARQALPLSDLFPELRVLKIRNLYPLSGKNSKRGATLFKAAVQTLGEWLASRRIDALHFNNCDIPDIMIALLRARLGQVEVVWDKEMKVQ